MTPTLDSFTIPSSLTGYSSDQTINPSELNLWRVIKINDDGTIDLVSEYASSAEITFFGITGYQNYVGTLNLIASAYGNSNYTVSSRHMGYNGQTPFLSENAPAVVAAKNNTEAKWYSETEGGGDRLYQTDVDLVKNACGTLLANGADTKNDNVNYSLAGRYYYYASSNNWHLAINYFRVVSEDVNSTSLWRSDQGDTPCGLRLRPIVVLKSGLSVSSGDGSSTSPWTFS